MALFKNFRDISMFRHVNRELINNIIEQKIGYYKISLERTEYNTYGESNGKKIYNDPVLINCIVDRANQTTITDDFGPDVKQTATFRFLKDDLAGFNLSPEQPSDIKGFTYNILPEIGDIIVWNDEYYEVDTVIENQYIGGKNPDYSYSSDTDNFGSSFSIICETHYIRPELTGITKARL